MRLKCYKEARSRPFHHVFHFHSYRKVSETSVRDYEVSIPRPAARLLCQPINGPEHLRPNPSSSFSSGGEIAISQHLAHGGSQWSPTSWAMARILGVSTLHSLNITQLTNYLHRNQITAWTGMIRVDKSVYTWMGAPGPQSVTQLSATYTSTRSIFTMNVNNLVEMNITFLSPLYPEDLKRQSLIFSYLDVAVQSIDGLQHDVQLYTDISAGESL